MSSIDIAVIGGQKCATTSVRNALAARSEIYVPHGEEDVFDDPELANVDVVRRLQVLKSRAGTRRIAIKRADILYSLIAQERLLARAPGARLVVVVRDPVDRAVSAYVHSAGHGVVPDLPPSLGLRLILNGELDRDYPQGREVLSKGLFGQHISGWLKDWPSDRFYIAQQSELGAGGDAWATLSRFLLISPPLEEPARSSNKGAYGPRRMAWRQLASRVRDDGSHPVSSLAGRLMFSADARVLERFSQGERPALDDGTWGELADYYAEDQTRLAAIQRELRAQDDWRL